MALLDLLGRKTALRILWELRHAPLTFRALEDAAETNPSVLNIRLRELRQAGIVDLTEAGYELTGDGAELLDRLMPLTAWADGWARRTQKRRR
jgi:DNA-binding HxlR family transcriptional regulator